MPDRWVVLEMIVDSEGSTIAYHDVSSLDDGASLIAQSNEFFTTVEGECFSVVFAIEHITKDHISHTLIF